MTDTPPPNPYDVALESLNPVAQEIFSSTYWALTSGAAAASQAGAITDRLIARLTARGQMNNSRRNRVLNAIQTLLDASTGNTVERAMFVAGGGYTQLQQLGYVT